MRAGYIDDIKKASFRSDLPEPQIMAPNEVKIRVKVTGICGSEIHAYNGLHNFRVPPLVSGHEFSGDVVEVGSEVTTCKVGDRVTAEPQYGCGNCYFCNNGNYNICPDKKVLGATYWTGSFGEYVVVPQQTIVKLLDSVSYEEGALIEPIAVGMHAVRKFNINKNSSVAIIGTGTIGLGILLCAKLFNPKMIIMIDVIDYNLEKAREMGCNFTLNSMSEDIESKIMELTEGIGTDVTFLAFGNEPTLRQACSITKRGGIISEIAIIKDRTPFSFGMLQSKELTMVGSNMYIYDDFQAVCDAIAEGKMDLSKFVTKIYPIEEMPKAMRVIDNREEPIIKILLKGNSLN